MKILVLNGPNLNLLGMREPEIYGTETLEEIRKALEEEAASLGVEIDFRQSNHEGELIDLLHGAVGVCDGVLLNPGGLTHTSVSLADAVRAVRLPTVEVHLANIHTREEYRRHSFTAQASLGVVAGFRGGSYTLALRGLVDHLRRRRKP